MKGSIGRRGETWTAYWSTVDPATGKRVQHSHGGFVRAEPARKPKGDSAREHLNSIIGSAQSGEYRRESAMTVKTLLSDHYLPARRSEGLRPTTLDQYSNVVDAWVLPHLGGTLVRRLTPATVLAWQTTLETTGAHGGRPLSPRSVQVCVTVLKAATSWAFTNGYLQRDPLAGYKRPRGGGSRAKSVWTAEQASTFLRLVRGDRLEAAWWLLLTFGLRRGELAGLRWSAVDLDAGVLRVVETLVVVDGHSQPSEPKTNSGRRALSLDSYVLGVLKVHRKAQLEERMKAGSTWIDTGYVFTDELGAPLRPERLSDRFVELAEAAKLPALTIHGLRHTSASLMLSKGVDVATVAGVLGHSSPTTTMDIYRHLYPGETARAGELMTSVLLGNA
jgi:integrase